MGINVGRAHVARGRNKEISDMGFLDKIKDLVGGNADKAKDAVDKTADVVDDKTGGQDSDKIDMGADKINDVIDDQAEDVPETE